MKRGCRYEPFNDSHIRYCWVAYRRGVLTGPLFQSDMTPETFRAHIVGIGTGLVRSGGDIYILIGRTARGEIPVGLVICGRSVGVISAPQANPHVLWFPEASPRNRIECAARFLVDLKKEQNVTITAVAQDWPFFGHLCKYGILRPVGKYRGWGSDGSDAMIYQGVR